MTTADSLPDLEIHENGLAIPVTDAEILLLEKAKTGETAEVSTGRDISDPAAWTKDQTIRGPFLRHLCLHPDRYGMDAKGITIVGALIKEQLNLDCAKVLRRLGVFHSRFTNTPILQDTHCQTLALFHCHLPGLEASRLRVAGTLILNESILTGETNLLGAQIGGNLEFIKAHFNNPDGHNFLAQRLTVKERFFWTKLATPPQGRIDLSHANVGDFVDDGSGWPEQGDLLIDGFHYEHLALPTSAAERCTWLDLMPNTWEGQLVFWPQPYEQLIKVFRNAGQDLDARKVAIAKQNAYRSHLRARAMLKQKDDDGEDRAVYVPGEGFFLRRFGLWVAGWSISYGYESWRALVVLLGALILGVYVFAGLDNGGLIEPAKERIYTHPCYINNTDPACQHWTVIAHTGKDGATRYLPPDYPAFNAFIYSLDVLLPIVDLKLEDHWMASSRSTWGRFYFWLHIAMGWVFTTIAVAGFTGLIKKD